MTLTAAEKEEIRIKKETKLRRKIMDRWLIGRPSGHGKTRLHLAVKMCQRLGVTNWIGKEKDHG